MGTSFRDSEPENWYRGVHEGGHATAIWALGGRVTKIEVRNTHHDDALNARQRAIVARAGRLAEALFGNADAQGCDQDDAMFAAAIEEVRRTEDDAAADEVVRTADADARAILVRQRGVVEAFGDPVGKLIHHNPSAGQPRELTAETCEEIARNAWDGEFPPDRVENDEVGQSPDS